MNDSRNFQDAEYVRSGHSHVTSQPVSFPPHPVPHKLLHRSIGMPSRKDGPPKHLGHTWYIGKRFCRSSRVFSSTLSAGVESVKFSHVGTFTHHRRGRMRIKHQFRTRDASPDRSAKNSVIPSEGDSSKNYGEDQHRLQISDLHFDKFRTPATLTCWKIRFKTEVYTCSQFPTEALPMDQRVGDG